MYTVATHGASSVKRLPIEEIRALLPDDVRLAVRDIGGWHAPDEIAGSALTCPGPKRQPQQQGKQGSSPAVASTSASDSDLAAADAYCSALTKRWQNGGAVVEAFKYQRVAELFEIAGLRVLEWGADCGNGMEYLVSKYKFTGAAVERDAAKGFWGRHHLTSFNSVPFCAGDASVTRFGPDTFDLVLSNSAFESWAPKESVCQAAKDALTMLRPGGCAWIGNLGG